MSEKLPLKTEAIAEEQRYWEPEEIKEWPPYIRERFALVNKIHNLDIAEIKRILSESPSEDIKWYVAYEIGERAERQKFTKEEISEMLPSVISLVQDEVLEIHRAGLFTLQKLGQANSEIFEELSRDRRCPFRHIASVLSGPENVRLSSLIKLSKDRDWHSRSLAASFFGNLGEAGLNPLRNLAKDSEWFIRRQAALSLSKVGEAASPLLLELARDRNSTVCEAAILSLCSLGKRGEGLVIELAKDEDPFVREVAAFGLGKLGKTALSLLIELAKDEQFFVRKTAALALSEHGSLEELLKLVRDKDDYVREEAFYGLAKLGNKATDKLRELTEDNDLDVRRRALAASDSILAIQKMEDKKFREKATYSLIVREEPVLANPLVSELRIASVEEENPLIILSDIMHELKIDYPELVGLTVLGSLSKGYWLTGRDIDWGLVFQSVKPGETISEERIDEIKKEFKEKASGKFAICVDQSFDASRSLDASGIRGAPEIVFNGLFVGDRDRLGEIQRAILQNINEPGWKEIQKRWRDELYHFFKIIRRFGLTEEEADLIGHLRSILWMPPDLQTMKRLLGVQEVK